MWTRITVVLSCITLLFLYGCVPNGDDHTPITDADFRQGVKGVTLELLPNAPPESVYEDGSFEVGFTLQNDGGYDAEGFLAFGLEHQYMDVTVKSDNGGVLDDKIYPFFLERRSVNYPQGGMIFKTFQADAKAIDRMSEYHDSNILLTACYRYQTVVSPAVCIDTDIYNLKPGDKPCVAKDFIFDGQGAPIAITEIREEMLPDGEFMRPSFLIFIENKGRGQTIHPDKVKDVCTSTRLDPMSFNTVYLKKAVIGTEQDGFVYEFDTFNNQAMAGNHMECTPNPLRLKEERDYIRCTLNDAATLGSKAISKDTRPYATPLVIELDYGYTFTISHKLRIQKPLRY